MDSVVSKSCLQSERACSNLQLRLHPSEIVAYRSRSPKKSHTESGGMQTVFEFDAASTAGDKEETLGLEETPGLEGTPGLESLSIGIDEISTMLKVRSRRGSTQSFDGSVTDGLAYRLNCGNLLLQDEGPEQILFELFSEDGVLHIDHFLSELRRTGLREDDPRIAESMKSFAEFKKKNHSGAMTEEEFALCIERNIVMLSKAFGAEFQVQNFEQFSNDIEKIFNDCRMYKSGLNAQYIPQLAKMNPNYWGVSICTVDGQRVSFGDSNIPFTIQSASKPLTYAIAGTDKGPEYVHNFVGFEPSGRSFNEITLDSKKRPHNPMINAGAIITASLVKQGCSAAEKFEYISTKFKNLAGNVGHVGFNNSVFLSERETAWRNFALAYFMKENGCFPPSSEIPSVLDLYFQICSMEVDCESMSIMAGTLAKGGVCPISEKKLLEPDVVRDTLSLIFSCGMYDYSGQFAFEVGLPAKSAVSGAIMLVIPNVCGICCFAPPLDSCGNSVKGVQFCNRLVKKFGFHNFNVTPIPSDSHASHPSIVEVLFAAQKGDLSAFRRFSLQGVDLNQKDYDSRTALHIASAEGHLEVVSFLLERCKVDRHAKDRWGNTPLSEALAFKKIEVADYLKSTTATRHKRPSMAQVDAWSESTDKDN